MSDLEKPTEWGSLLQTTKTSLEDDISQALEKAEKEDLVEMLTGIRDLQSSLKLLEKEVENTLVEMGIKGGGERVKGTLVEVTRVNQKTTWDYAKVVTDLKKTLAVEVDPETGELVTQPKVEGVIDTMLALVGATAASFSNWRVTPMKELGLNPDDYREKTGGNLKVITE